MNKFVAVTPAFLVLGATASPALADQNTIIGYTGLGTAYVATSNGFTYPFVNVSPGTYASGGYGPAVAAGNINIVPGLFTQATQTLYEPGLSTFTNYTVPDVTGSITLEPIQYGPGSQNGQPQCFIESAVTGDNLVPSYQQQPNGAWYVTFDIVLGDRNPTWLAENGFTRNSPIPASLLQDGTIHQMRFICVPKGPNAPPVPLP